MDRDSHSISEAYLKSRLLREQTNQAEEPEEWPEDFTPERIELEKWERKYPMRTEEWMEDIHFLEFYFKKRMNEILNGGDYYVGPDDPIIYELLMKYLSKGEDGRPRLYDGGRWKDEDEIVDDLRNSFFEERNPRIDSDDNDSDFDSERTDDDPTGQDEPIDTRSYSDVRTSDRLDYANKMVRSGKWDPEQAAEYKRGA